MLFGMQIDWALGRPRMLGVLRIMIALLYLQHGLAKLTGFPSPSPANFTLVSLIGVAGIIEVFGSLLLLVGLFTREIAFIMSGQMAVAYFMVRASVSFYPIVNRGEIDVLYCFIFLYFVFAGPGAWSLDARRPGAVADDAPPLPRR